MTLLNTAISLAGIAKQTAKGTPATTPVYAFGVVGGKVAEAPITQSDEQRAFSQRGLIAVNRTLIVPGAAYKIRAHPGSIAAHLYAALGSNADSGAGPDYTHIATGGNDLPYFTLWGQLDTGEFVQVSDAKLDQLTLAWTDNEPAEVDATWLACAVNPYFGSFPAATNDEQQAAYFAPPGGTFKLDSSSGTPVAAPIHAGTLQIMNNVIAQPISGSVLPNDVKPQQRSVQMSLTTVPGDLAEWRKILTGTGTGTTPSNAPIYGSFDVLFQVDANTSLELEGTNTAFNTDFPDTDPTGKPAELVFTGSAALAASLAAELTATTKNQVATAA